MSSRGEPIDAVYTWVDDTWPGYADLIRQYASNRHDLNPNRYRDNVDILKYSLRSLQLFVPWVRRVYLVTCRPQVPRWLNRDAVVVVHHDEFIDPEHLPTFNSFAIVSHLHRLPGLSRRFIYIEDDRLFGCPVGRGDFFENGQTWVYQALRGTPGARREAAADDSPWNLALAHSNALLDARYRPRRRGTVKFAPLAVERDRWDAMRREWPDEFARTAASRFRARGNVAPEHLYPYYLLNEGCARIVPRLTFTARAAYHPLNNIAPFQWLGLGRLRVARPAFVCLNDDFGARPRPSVVAYVRRTLARWFPVASRFERERAEETEGAGTETTEERHHTEKRSN